MKFSAGPFSVPDSQSGRCYIHRIKKRRNTYRTIYIPSTEYRAKLATHKPLLLSILGSQSYNCADHAFVTGRNAVTNASSHIDKQHILSLDIRDFFDSIGKPMLSDKLPSSLLSLVLEDGAPRQGLLTSPIVANIAMLDIDHRIYQLCDALGDISYSRYADDLTFGFNNIDLFRPIYSIELNRFAVASLR